MYVLQVGVCDIFATFAADYRNNRLNNQIKKLTIELIFRFMKKYFSMIAIAIASVMMFSSCSKEEKTELIDPDKPTNTGKQELEVEVNAVITGAMTKALSIKIEYIDFGKDKSEVVVLNENYDGKNCSFNKKFSAEGKGKKFGILVSSTIASDYNTFKSEPAPWNAEYTITVKHNGVVDDAVSRVHDQKVSESNPSITLFDSHLINWPHLFAHEQTVSFGGQMDYVMINEDNDVVWTRK